MSVEAITTSRYQCTCEAVNKKGIVCGHKWESDEIPDRCAACKKRTWNRASLRPGRTGNPIKAFSKEQTLVQWGKEYGISPSTISGRIKIGWTIEDAIALPVHKKSEAVHENP